MVDGRGSLGAGVVGVTTALNRCLACEELGAGELHPWPDEPWGLKLLCALCVEAVRQLERSERHYLQTIVMAKARAID